MPASFSAGAGWGRVQAAKFLRNGLHDGLHRGIANDQDSDPGGMVPGGVIGHEIIALQAGDSFFEADGQAASSAGAREQLGKEFVREALLDTLTRRVFLRE